MLPELAPEHAALLALLFADDLPCRLERVWPDAPRVERHLGAVDGAVDIVSTPACQAQAHGVDLVQVAEDLELQLRRDCGEGCAGVGLREERQPPHHVRRHFELPLVLICGGHVCFGAREAIEVRFRSVRRGRRGGGR